MDGLTSLQSLFNEQWHSLSQGIHDNPHAILGLHSLTEDSKVIRLFRPGATAIHLEICGHIVAADPSHEAGFFEYIVPSHINATDYRVYHQSGLLAHDPYAFRPIIGEVDRYLFSRGVHYQLYKVMGAQICQFKGIVGTQFVVWAPNAKNVALIGDFNYWDGRVNPMRNVNHSGIWELFVPGLGAGAKYKFELKTQSGDLRIKADPLAFAFELRPATASIVADVSSFAWEDGNWMAERAATASHAKPMTVYEVHLGSWKKHYGHFLNYRELAVELANYCKELGYTHVELLPLQEHPLDESWGYQVTGFFAPTSRYGKPEDFQWFVNHLHKNGIGVLLDWVPGHFPTDDFSLGRFDGTALYEHASGQQGMHPHWFTYIFNLGRHEVSNFLISSALFWFDMMHVDGLRVDAVASMLYLDYGRKHGEWVPNVYGSNENLESIEFFKHLNSIVHEKFPGILMVAEESTSFTGVSHSLHHGGLGFDMKWNMGWMHDTLHYFSRDMLYRHYHHNDLTFGLLYAFSERFQLALSHDEVVHGKNSLLSKMPGDLWQKFANLRLLYSYMICQPGKKLIFMGGDIGQWNEWNCKGEIEWFLLQFHTHAGLQTMVKEINHFYLANSSFWERDFSYEGFEWVDFSDRKNSVISYLRKGSQGAFLCVHNFTPIYLPEYQINLAGLGGLVEVFNTDALQYGGSGKLNHSPTILRSHDNFPYAIRIQLAPLATMIFKLY